MDNPIPQNQALGDERKKKIAGCWDEWSGRYDYGRSYSKDLVLKEDEAWKGFFCSEFGTKPLKILDVGTGTGFLSIPLAELGHQVVGVDMSPGMMSRCMEKAHEKKLDMDLRMGDAESLPFEDESFDVVVSRWVLWTLLHPDKSVSEWYRVLKPGGRAYAFDTPFVGKDRNKFDNRIRRNMGRVLITIVERRNAWSETYGKELNERLPLNYDKPGSFDRQVKLFVDCGFSDVMALKMDDASEVSKEMWKRRPWRYRLSCKWNQEWYCVSCHKS